MSTSPKSVRFDADTMWVELDDGRTLGCLWRGFHAFFARVQQTDSALS